jgi:putative inorganic carbon (HCO3(-)) transporter
MRDKIRILQKIDLDRLREYSLWAIIFCLPFSKSIAEIGIAAACIITVLKILVEKRITAKRIPLLVPLGLFCAISALSVFWSVDFSLSLRALLTKVIKYIALFYILYDFVDSERKARRMLAVVLASVLLITVNGLIQQYITGFDLLHRYPSFKYVTYPDAKFPTYKMLAFKLPPEQRGYATSSFPYPNDYATWIISLLPLALLLSLFGLRKDGIRMKVSGFMSLSLLAYSLFLTKTRGAWIALCAGVVVMAIARSKKLIVWFLCAVLLFYLIMPQHVKDAVGSRLSFRDRMDMWSVSLEMIKERPFRGFGLNTYFDNFRIYRKDQDRMKRGSYAHNCYLQQAADTGIPGLLIFVYLLFSLLYVSGRRIAGMRDAFYANYCLGIWTGLFTFAVYAFVDTGFYSLPLVTLFWFLAGLLFGVIRVYEEKTS